MASQLDRIEARIEKVLALLQKNVAAETEKPTAPAIPPPILQTPVGDAEYQERVRQRDENLARWAEQAGSEVVDGLSGVRAADLSDEDKAFMRHVRENAHFRLSQAGKYRNQDVYRALLSGSGAEINQAIQDGEYSNTWARWKNDMSAAVTEYHRTGNHLLVSAYDRWITNELNS